MDFSGGQHSCWLVLFLSQHVKLGRRGKLLEVGRGESAVTRDVGRLCLRVVWMICVDGACSFSYRFVMFSRAITYTLSVTVFSIALLSASCYAFVLSPQQSDVSRTTATHLVLTNGQVVVGQISRDANSVFVQTDGGSRVVFPIDRVEFVCNSLTDAYWQKNARVKASDLDAHVELFHWCMKQGLLQEAQNQIDLLLTMEINAVKLEYLNRQLLVALNQQRRFHQQLLARQNQSEAPPKQVVPDVSKPEIALVGFETEQFRKSEAKRLNHLKQIETAIESIPKKSVGVFKRKVEPLLVRNCGGCHSVDKTETMPLERLGKNQVIPKRLSQRNLYHILKQTDLNQPLASPLFAAAVHPHAGLPEPILKRDSVQYVNLGQWLIQISARPNERHMVPDFEALAALPTVQPERVDVPQAVAQGPAPANPTLDVPRIPQLRETRTIERAETDPFNADLFNRKHLNPQQQQD